MSISQKLFEMGNWLEDYFKVHITRACQTDCPANMPASSALSPETPWPLTSPPHRPFSPVREEYSCPLHHSTSVPPGSSSVEVTVGSHPTTTSHHPGTASSAPPTSRYHTLLTLDTLQSCTMKAVIWEKCLEKVAYCKIVLCQNVPSVALLGPRPTSVSSAAKIGPPGPRLFISVFGRILTFPHQKAC